VSSFERSTDTPPPQTYAILDLRSFRRVKIKLRKKSEVIFLKRAAFFLVSMKEQWEKDDGRTFLGNNTRDGVVNLRPIRPQCFWVRISSNELPCIHIVDHRGDGKAIPLQAWAGPKGFTRLRIPRFLESAYEVVSLSALCTGRLYTPGNIPGTHLSEA